MKIMRKVVGVVRPGRLISDTCYASSPCALEVLGPLGGGGQAEQTFHRLMGWADMPLSSFLDHILVASAFAENHPNHHRQFSRWSQQAQPRHPLPLLATMSRRRGAVLFHTLPKWTLLPSSHNPHDASARVSVQISTAVLSSVQLQGPVYVGVYMYLIESVHCLSRGTCLAGSGQLLG